MRVIEYLVYWMLSRALNRCRVVIIKNGETQEQEEGPMPARGMSDGVPDFQSRQAPARPRQGEGPGPNLRAV